MLKIFLLLKFVVSLYKKIKEIENMSATFEHLGFHKDYYVNGKYFGSLKVSEADREIYGYEGRKSEITNEEVVWTKPNGTISKKIAKGTQVSTELIPLCGKLIK